MLVAGHGIVESNAFLIPLLGRIGESLLSTSGAWRLRRLSQIAGERDVPDRASLKRHVNEVAEQDVEALLIAVAGLVTVHDDEPCLVTGAEHRANPEDATLSLRWIAERLRACRADRLVMVASFAVVRAATLPSGRAGHAEGWLDALGTRRPRHVVVLGPTGTRGAALEALLDGLGGAALDPRTGTITLRSISEHLGRVPGVMLQSSDESQTLASSPPLTGPWDVRLSRSVMANEQSDPEDLVGTVLPGKFRIDGAIAHGSFGRVYRARQLAVERDVAVKVLAGTVDPRSDVGRLFIHEIQSVGRIDHPNVVRVFQADITASGRLFYAMELLAGRDLQQIIDAEGVMPRARATELVLQLVSALAAAHEVGLVHADVKPANTFVVPAKAAGERLVLLDFGFARLRASDQPVESAGGTPAYMAPEQLHDGRVDGRSDLFAAALVLVTLLTGWRRRRADELAPPLDGIDDANLRATLARALALAPDERYQTAGELAAALGGAAIAAQAPNLAPFRHLAPFTESDHDRLFGRDRELAVLVEHVLYRRAVIYTAPSGTGKTSLLRAGLVPRLAALGVECVYVACRGGSREQLAKSIGEGASLAEAASARAEREHRRLVIVVDQLEAALVDLESASLLREVTELERLHSGDEVAVVLSVREDFLGGALAHEGLQAIPVVRLGPLGVDAAREAIVKPLTERRLAITDELLDALLYDLSAAAAAIAPQLKWTGEHVVYPPHLQLACSVLYESLQPGEATLELHHYRRLGGLDAIVGEYLERVLESELPATATGVARAVLLALVNTNQTRAFRTEAELVETMTSTSTELELVLEALRARGIIVRLRSATGELGWELVHDSLVPRVLAWLDRRDLARRRALELVRHHVRRSRDQRPSLLEADELQELRGHADAIDELDAEWRRRGGGPIQPSRLVQLSRRARRTRIIGVTAAIAGIVVVALVLAYRWLDEREERRHADLLSKADVGSFVLELHAFDWDVATQSPITVSLAELPGLDWALYEPSADDTLTMGEPPSPIRYERTELPSSWWRARSWQVEVRGGDAILVVRGRGRHDTAACASSKIPLRRLPGYASRGQLDQRLVVQVPSCDASTRDLITIGEGPYISGGMGEPPVALDENLQASDIPPERVVTLDRFDIDRMEVTNGAYRIFTPPANATMIPQPQYPPTAALKDASDAAYPVANVSWPEARAFCRFLGKELPTDQQWQKAMRGGLFVNGVTNPFPRRNFPWGNPTLPIMANVADTGGRPHRAGATVGDQSPYGVLDLAGNVQEWTGTLLAQNFIAARGCSWGLCTSSTLATFMSVPNARAPRFTYYELGFRCAQVTQSPSAETRSISSNHE